MRRLYLIIVCFLWCSNCFAEDLGQFKITFYDSCVKCCGKSDGITASGHKAKAGTVACNWLPFHTKLMINGKQYEVLDRGAKSLFGDKKHHIKHIDIWLPKHNEALSMGVKWLKVARID